VRLDAELHPTKTQIVHCKDGRRKATYPNVKFDFLGYSFQPRLVKRSWDNNPAVSATALTAMRTVIRDLNICRRAVDLGTGALSTKARESETERYSGPKAAHHWSLC
jgi:hypothetical protein